MGPWLLRVQLTAVISSVALLVQSFVAVTFSAFIMAFGTYLIFDTFVQARNQVTVPMVYIKNPLKPLWSCFCHYLVTRSFTVQQSYRSF